MFQLPRLKNFSHLRTRNKYFLKLTIALYVINKGVYAIFFFFPTDRECIHECLSVCGRISENRLVYLILKCKFHTRVEVKRNRMIWEKGYFDNNFPHLHLDHLSRRHERSLIELKTFFDKPYCSINDVDKKFGSLLRKVALTLFMGCKKENSKLILKLIIS